MRLARCTVSFGGGEVMLGEMQRICWAGDTRAFSRIAQRLGQAGGQKLTGGIII